MSKKDNIEMTLSDVKKVLLERFLFQLANPELRLRPLYLEGHAGIGKSQTIRQAAEAIAQATKLNVECRVLNLQFCERPDFMGLPHIDAAGNTSFARPIILPKDGAGILFLDEANRVESELQSGMLTLLEDRNINGHQIGQNWMIVLAGNPNTSASGSRYKVVDFDHALLDRIAKIRVTGSILGLTGYLEKKFPGHPLLKFLEHFPEFVSFNGEGCSPRSFEYAMRATLGFDEVKSLGFRRNLSIELGSEAATHILGILESGFIPTFKSIMQRDPRLYEYLDSHGDRQDVLLALVDQVYSFIVNSAEEGGDLNPDDVSAIVQFLMATQNEHRIALFERIRGSKYSVYFGKYFLKNTRLAEALYAKRASAS